MTPTVVRASSRRADIVLPSESRKARKAEEKEVQLARARRLWERLTFEINLMTARTNWLVTSQSFLFAAYFLGAERLRDGLSATEGLVFAVPVIGISISGITIVYIGVAHASAKLLRDQLIQLREDYAEELRDRMDETSSVPQWRAFAQNASLGLACLFFGIWIGAFALLVMDQSRGSGPFSASPEPLQVEVVKPRINPPR